MDFKQVLNTANLETGHDLHGFASELYPICRSITGDGVRETLRRIGERISLQITEVPSGTAVFDWLVPKEWNIKDAYIKDAAGRKVLDFQDCNLHVMSYSCPVNARMPLGELRKHLFTIPDHPNWIPYRTSYYKEDWGFCLPAAVAAELNDAEYEVCIDSTLEDGLLTYGECFLRGASAEEALFSVHVCHPSLANDNLSGIAVATALAQRLAQMELRYSYRFLFLPGTIGAITWLALNRDRAERIKHGLVLTCVGDKSGFHYKKSRRGDSEIDVAVKHALKFCSEPGEIMEFSPYGYDERQYCSPGFNLAVGCLMRSVWGSFPEYHTSADNLDFILPEKMAGTLELCSSVVNILENNKTYLNTNPYCEPQLGKRGLYRSTGGHGIEAEINARLWTLNLSDGKHSLLAIAERSNLPFEHIHEAAETLKESGLLAEI